MILYSHRQGEYWQSRTHSANQPFVAFYQNSLSTSAAPLLVCLSDCLSLCLAQALIAKSWINPGLAPRPPQSQTIPLCVCVELQGQVVDLKLHFMCLNTDLISDRDHTITKCHWWVLFVCVCVCVCVCIIPDIPSVLLLFLTGMSFHNMEPGRSHREEKKLLHDLFRALELLIHVH